MPLYDFLCADCGHVAEVLTFSQARSITCERCGSGNLNKLMSAHASFSGKFSTAPAGPGDTACCGSSPASAGCAGPGSCCGKG